MECMTGESGSVKIGTERDNPQANLTKRVFGNSLLFTRIASKLDDWRDHQNLDLINRLLNDMAALYHWPTETGLEIARSMQNDNRCDCDPKFSVFVQGRQVKQLSSLPTVASAILRKCPKIDTLCITLGSNRMTPRFLELIRLLISEIAGCIWGERLSIETLAIEIYEEPALSAIRTLLNVVKHSIKYISMSKDDDAETADVGFGLLKQSPTLKEVEIEYDISETDFRQVCEIEALQVLHLGVRPVRLATERIAKIFVDSGILLHLKKLGFQNRERNDTQILLKMFPVRNSIESFDSESVRGIDDAHQQLSLVAERLPKLREFTALVDMTDTENLTDAEIARQLADLALAALFQQFRASVTVNIRLAGFARATLQRKIKQLLASMVKEAKQVEVETFDYSFVRFKPLTSREGFDNCVTFDGLDDFC